MIYSFTAVNRSLMAWGGVLRRISADQFYDLESNVITFEKVNGGMKARLVIEGETYFSSTRVGEPRLTDTELAACAGRFHSEELDATYDFSVEQGALRLRIGNNPKTLGAIAPDQFEVNDLGAIVVFDRDDRKRVRGLKLFSQSARGIEFERVN
jgi:hypothetical protein